MTNPYTQQINTLTGGQSKSLAPVSVSNPYTKQILDAGQTTNDIHENDNGFFSKLGDFASYLTSIPDRPVDPLKSTSDYVSASKLALSNMSNDLSGILNYWKNTAAQGMTGLQQAAQDAKGLVSSLPSGEDNPFALKNTFSSKGILSQGASGMLDMIQKPIEAATYTTNDHGTAKPSTVEDQAQALQATAGIVAQIGTFQLTKSALLGTLPKDEAAVEAMAPSLAGKVSGGLRKGLNNIAAEAGAGALSGGVQAAIASSGQDNQGQQIISSALSFIPVGAALGMLGASDYVSDIRNEATRFKQKSTLDATHDIAAVNSLRVNPADPINDLIKKTDAVSSADKLVQAAINYRLSVGDGYIVEGVSKELGDKLSAGVIPSSSVKPRELSPADVNAGTIIPQNGDYVVNSELRKPRPRPNSTEVKFDSNIDKLAYLASGKKGPSAFVQKLVDDWVKQTGLPEEDLITHGKSVRDAQKKAFRTDKLVPQNQAEIDVYNTTSLENGKKLVAALPDGGSVKASDGNTYIRQGSNVIDSNSSVSLPLDQSTTLQILGRRANDTPFYQPYQRVEAQDWNPNYGRVDVPKGSIRSIYSDTGNLLVTPQNYRPDALAFFKKNGFMQGEIVSSGGAEHVIIGDDPGGLILKNVTDGSNVIADPADLRRTNHSLTPELIKYPIDEQVTHGAIRTENGRYFHGADHGTIAKTLRDNGLTAEPPGFGFKTNKNRFISSDEAYNLGKANGQLSKDSKDYNISTEEFRYKNKNFGSDVVPGGLGLKSITPKEFIPSSSDLIGIKAPTLNPNNVVAKLYDNFKSTFDSAPDQQSFSGTLQKFFHENSIETKDQSHIATLMTKKLGDDLAAANLTPEELASRNDMLRKFNELKVESEGDHATHLSNLATSNNLFFSPEGGGKYRLRYSDTGKTYAIVSNPDEALNAINKIRQSNGLEYDGGFTGVIPTGVSNLGGLAGDYSKVGYSRSALISDMNRLGGKLSPKVTPIYSQIKAIDNISGGVTNLAEPWLKLNNAQMLRSTLASIDPLMGKLAKDGQNILNKGSTIPSDRRLVAADNADTMTIDQVKNNYHGSRTANAYETELANQIVKSGDVGKVQDLLYKAKMISPGANLGGQVYMTNLLALGKNADPAILKAASVFAQTVAKLPKDIVFGPLILRLAEALESPSTALDAKSHAKINGINSKEAGYIADFKKWFADAAPVAGIDPKATFGIYLPNIIKSIAGSVSETSINPEFAREMSRVGITPRNEMIRDPNQLLSKYYTSLLNHKSGFYDAVKEFQDTSNSELDKLKGTKNEDLIPRLKDKIDAHVREVLGYPNPDDALNKAMDQVRSNLGFRAINPNSLLALYSLANIAGRPILALRDFSTVFLHSYKNFGAEFTKEVFNNSLSRSDVKWMKDNNKLGSFDANSVNDPAYREGELNPLNVKIPFTNKTIQDVANAGFRWTGQEAAYEHTATGVYKGSMSMAARYFDKLQNGEITKDEAFTKLGIRSNYGPGITTAIDNHLQNGRSDLAADLYAQSNMRLVSHIYGFNNNPIGWKSNFGRFMSQYGSYGANAMATFRDDISKGTKADIAAKLARTGLIGLALGVAGHALGINLTSWMVNNPLDIIPGTGPMFNMIQENGEKVMNGQIGLGDFAVKGTMNFIPYSKAAQDWVDGLDQVGQGELLKGLWKVGGGSINR